MLTGMIALVLFSSVDTDLVLQRHVADLCAYKNRVCVEDAKPAETVNVQPGLLFQAPDCVYVGLTAHRAGADVGTGWLRARGEAPESMWSTVQTMPCCSPWSQLRLRAHPGCLHAAPHTTLSSMHRVQPVLYAYSTLQHCYMCSPISASPLFKDKSYL